MAKSILVRQKKGFTNINPDQKATLKALGVRGIGSTIYRKDTVALRGMLNKVQHLITAEQVEASATPRPAKKKSNAGYKLG